MRLFNEIGGNLLRNVAPKGRCLFFTGGGGYFQGVKSFDGFSPKTVTLRFSVGKFQSGDFELLGRIFSMEYFTAAAPATPETIVNAAAPANKAATPEIAAQAAKDGGK